MPAIFSDAIVKAMDDSSSIRAFSEDFSQEVVIFKNSKGDFILESWNGGLLELTVRYDHWPLNYLLSSFAWLKYSFHRLICMEGNFHYMG